ncbi:MAG: tetratricopeptide repeat protein [Candidatus Omnitrophota bacterium]
MRQSRALRIDLLFLLISTIALSLRALYFRQTISILEPSAGSDAYFYLEWAKDIIRVSHVGRETWYAFPVYPYFLCAAYILSAGDVLGVYILQMLIGSCNCGLIYLLGKKLFNTGVGIFAGIIACAYPLFLFYDRLLVPVTLAIFFALLALVLLIRAQENPTLRSWLSAGIVSGIAALTRPAFTVVIIFLFLWMLYEYRASTWKRRGIFALSFILPCLVMFAGVSLRNELVLRDGIFAPAHSGINFYIGNNPQSNGLFNVPVGMRSTQGGLLEDARIIAEQQSGKALKPQEASRFWFNRSFQFMRQTPLAYFALLVKKVRLFLNGQEFVDDIEYYFFKERARFFNFPLFSFLYLLPLSLAGMLFFWPQRKRLGFLYLFISALMCATVLFFINSRYRLLAVPFLIIFAAGALWLVIEKIRQKEYKRILLIAGSATAFFIITSIDLTQGSGAPNFTFHYNKGVVYIQQGSYKEAEQEFRAALKINPQDFLSYFGLGNMYYKMRDIPKAQEAFEKTLEINPYCYEANFNLGIINQDLGDIADAESEFKRALVLKPDDSAAHYNLGRIYQQQGKLELALQEYNFALRLEPNHPEIQQAITKIKVSDNEK